MRQIVYFSTAAGRQDAIVTAGILAVSRLCNRRDGITGLLVAGGNRYLQVIEGSPAVIGSLLLRLRADVRHVGVSVLVDRRTNERSFEGWSMAFANEPRLGEFATLRDLAAVMRRSVTDPAMLDQIDSLVDTFAIDPPDLIWPASSVAVPSDRRGH